MLYNKTYRMERKMLVLFRKNKQRNDEESLENNDILALTSLVPLCNGQVRKDAFIIEDYDIYVYADVASLQDNVAQIVYQLHHEWLQEPIVESVAASGDTLVNAIHNAAQSFYEHILALYIEALTPGTIMHKERVVQDEYALYRSEINGVGRREGVLEGDFWDMLREDLLGYVRDDKVYWIRTFASKNKDNVICEVKINGKEISALSEKMIAYAEEWNCLDAYHTEKQGILLMKVDEQAQPFIEEVVDIKQVILQAIHSFDKCKSVEEYKAIRKQLLKQCNDESLAYEIFSMIPEFYCMYAYAKVEFKDAVYLVRKGEETKEVHKDQVSSYELVKDCVFEHLNNEMLSRDVIENVLQYSANAKAIQQALAQGNQMEELLLPGIGIRIPSNYKLK
ncbi:DUF6348 family protein [Amedibacillus sp. YH-ame10]